MELISADAEDRPRTRELASPELVFLPFTIQLTMTASWTSQDVELEYGMSDLYISSGGQIMRWTVPRRFMRLAVRVERNCGSSLEFSEIMPIVGIQISVGSWT